MALTILAQIEAAPGKEEALFAELQALIAPTLIEAGCLQYDLHRDNERHGFFSCSTKHGKRTTYGKTI